MNNLNLRRIKNNIALGLCAFSAFIGLFWLVFIIGDVIFHGISAINLDLFLEDPIAAGETGGGLRNAFLGQMMITLLATMIGVPSGILGGVYLAEFSRGTKYAQLLSILSDIMVSVPSIVMGAFAYAIFVKPVGMFNGWAGAVALAMIMIPVVLRTTEDMLKLVPQSLREAAYALGATRSQVTFHIVFRAASTGILTGILLSIARVSGETAPLLFTSFNNTFFSLDMNGPIASLTVTIFQYAMGPYKNWHSQAWAASFMITIFILAITIIGRYAIQRSYKK